MAEFFCIYIYYLMAEKAIWLDIARVCVRIFFNKLQAVGLFLAFDGASTRTDPFTSGKKYRKSVNNAVFITKAYSLFPQRLRVHSN